MGLFKKLISSVMGSIDDDTKKGLEEKVGSLKKGIGGVMDASNAAKEFLQRKSAKGNTEGAAEDQKSSGEVLGADFLDDDEENAIPEDAVLREDDHFKKCSKINIQNVAMIDENVFDGYKKLEEVCLSDSIRVIGNYAFYSCENLTEVHINSSSRLEVIGENAFAGCKMKAFNFPHRLKVIEESAFFECEKLEKVDLSRCVKLKAIKDKTFSGCCKLKFVQFPVGLQKIGREAFSDCELSNVVIPDSVEEIGTNAFLNCEDLNSLILPHHLHTINTLSENKISLSELDMSRCTELKEINCFLGDFEDLEQLVVPRNVEIIRTRELIKGDDLEAVFVPETLKVLELKHASYDIYCFSPKLESLLGLSEIKGTLYVKPEFFDDYRQQAETEGVDVEIKEMPDSKLKMY